MTTSTSNDIVRTLAENYISGVLRGCRFPAVSVRLIESDKRKQGKVLRELEEQGYIRRDPEKPNTVQIGFKAVQEYPTDEPDLQSVWESKRTECGFVSLHDLTVRQKAFIVLNGAAYIFAYSEPTMPGLDYTPGDIVTMQELPVERERVSNPLSSSWDLVPLVSTHALKDYSEATLREESIQKSIKRNLAWGLADQGVFKVQTLEDVPLRSCERDDLMSFGKPTHDTFVGEPAEWLHECMENIDSVRKRIQELKQTERDLLQMQDGIQTLGGFDAFLGSMREKIIQDMDK